MIEDEQNLNEILERISKGSQSESDISILRNSLKFDGERCFVQIGNDNISIGTAKDISIQRIYKGHDLETIQKVIKKLLQEIEPIDNTPIALLRRFEQTEECL